MWVAAGILLGIVVLSAIAGTHLGPHLHVISSVAGVVAAVWLVIMAAIGYADPVLYVLLAADVTMSAAVGLAGWKALKTPGILAWTNEPPPSIEGKMGVAVSALDPSGVVRIGGEQWTAVSLNGSVPKGGTVQAINVRGVRLEVWGETAGESLGSAEPKGEGAVS